ncbi:MAG: hypothetical protein JO337_05350, partial [Acidimicrobiales bacterium]|nr:hypothetical protein [Acidimicrobiales bacterium]
MSNQPSDAGTDRVLIISSDCHAGIPRGSYRDYLESRYHDDFDSYDASLSTWWET